jgi:hypothetical protein
MVRASIRPISPGRKASQPQSANQIRKSFLVLFSKKNKKNQRLIFEKRSKNSFLGGRGLVGGCFERCSFV